MPQYELFYKKCPVCGALADISSDGKICWCSNSNCFAYTYYIPMEQWNNRPEEDKLYERINFLEETNGALNARIVKLLNAILSITEDQKNIAEYYNGKSEKSD